jgi:hypothetical protein
MKKKNSPAVHLPKQAPKKTGKRGIQPLDPVADFDTPVKKEELQAFVDTVGDTEQQREEKRKKRKAAGQSQVPPSERGKTARLPGMEDPAIEELENAAREYAGTRDDRMHLLETEIELKGKLLDLMKKNNKELYKRDGIEIRLVHEKESVKVKVKKDEVD